MPEQPPEPHFEQAYQTEEHVWGTRPIESVASGADLMKPGSVLDLGAGDGRNAIFLASRGYDVTAVDIAPSGISKLQEYAEQAGVAARITGVVGDIAEFRPDHQFANIISTYTLHFLPPDDIRRVIGEIQQLTEAGGLNVIEDFIKTQPDLHRHWLASGELKQLYEQAGWEVLRYDEREVPMRATDEQGNPRRQQACSLTARKSSS